ncbi:class I SAM-dependent methyltransferase [Bordetella genomosp. 13]|uniref:Methyltransferase domain-containing protein n=1 Tax=Bordetella genomosp. 13 TaxID=463040 RepID=A0A1W6ZIK9_9BORD|nr:class I SAM-dependent methyltransferase [Bordetella genomosp. 13]ARP96980.1 hypothetical protein CAL15_22970 [Bordetella genomosp. 13]
MMPIDVNSQEYWNGRFDADWETNHGKEQSRFFSRVAYDNLPPWLIQRIGQAGWTLCDWGCAQGDGTDVLASYFGPEKVTGVDFAASAIEKARHTYTGIRFETQDWLTATTVDEMFDIVFSSNTLEHFARPYEILPRLLERARNCVILALPYQELDRIEEHFFSFLPENIPYLPVPGWVLTHAAVRDCRAMEPSYWHGHQVILVYARVEWLESVGLQLADIRFPSNESERQGADRRFADVIDDNTQAIRQLQADNRANLHAMEAMAQQLKAIGDRLEQLEAARVTEVKTLEMELAQLRSSTSWTMTQPWRWLGRVLSRR